MPEKIEMVPTNSILPTLLDHCFKYTKTYFDPLEVFLPKYSLCFLPQMTICENTFSYITEQLFCFK